MLINNYKAENFMPNPIKKVTNIITMPLRSGKRNHGDQKYDEYIFCARYMLMLSMNVEFILHDGEIHPPILWRC